MGSMRSQSETEKHIATTGIRPSKRAPIDGFFTCTVSDYNLPPRIDLGLLTPPAIVRTDHEQESSIARNRQSVSFD